MTMADLIALGAPKLPAGHFYRVKVDWAGAAWVQVRRERWWGSKLIIRDHVRRYARTVDGQNWPDRVISVESGLVDAATAAAQQATREIEMSRWAGDHR